MAYLLDSDVFIQAKNFHYGLDFCPAFWDWIDREHTAGSVLSIEKVGDELLAGGDALADWANERRPSFFCPPDEPVMRSFRVVSAWAYGAGYEAAAVNSFLQKADYYLVAHAHAHDHTVVTHEKPGATKTIKIPDACIGVQVSA